MKPHVILFITFSVILNITVPPVTAQDNPAQRWKSDIQTFMEWDGKNSFPENAVLFVGSSSIRYWKTHESFPNLKVINRGFGGSQVSDLLYYYDKLVVKYNPRIIVLYSGDNDIAVGKSAETTSNDYRRFIQLTHKKLPETPIIIIPVKPSRARWNYWPEMEKTNSILEKIANEDEMVYLVDTTTVLMTHEHKPDNNFFRNDQLHLNEKGYELWADILKKKITQVACSLEQKKQ